VSAPVSATYSLSLVSVVDSRQNSPKPRRKPASGAVYSPPMQLVADVNSCVDAMVRRVGKVLRVAAPLAIGKPNYLLNALYQRAKADPTLELEIYTALTLERPKGQSELERRFLGPFVERVFGDYPDLDYEIDRNAGRLPSNVRVFEFYVYAGKLLRNSRAQCDYISANYTHVARDLIARRVNVLAQSVCRGVIDGQPALSLSCNPDVSPDVLRGLKEAGHPHIVVGQVNDRLPFMYGDACVPEGVFDLLVDEPSQYHHLFATPKTSITDAEFAIGLYASTLVRDGGSLQIGIGSIGDALVYALLLRHQRNADYLRALNALNVLGRFGDVIERVGGTEPFERGLFAPTEMLVDGFMHLIEAGIVKRRVYDDLWTQRLIDAQEITDHVSLSTLDAYVNAGVVSSVLSAGDVDYLRRIGVLRADVTVDVDGLSLREGVRANADVTDAETRSKLEQSGLGDELSGGTVAHAGFFLGPQPFYDWLLSLDESRRRRIDMRTVTRVNQISGNDELVRLQRRHARFINTGMMATLFGAVVSDGLENGQVVSGVGGQYNFVAMGHALPDARSILQVRATRSSDGELRSNIVYSYGHTTIPRHLRDLLVTEYGIADLRSRTDEEVVTATLAVADATAQRDLVARAQQAGKLSGSFTMPPEHLSNTADTLEHVFAKLRREGLFPPFPFGTDLTPEEIELGRALRALKERTGSVQGEVLALTAAATHGSAGPDVDVFLQRMGLDDPSGVEETLYARLLAAELRRQRGLALAD